MSDKVMTWGDLARLGLMSWIGKILEEPFGLELRFNNWGSGAPMDEIVIGLKGSMWGMGWEEFRQNGLPWWVNLHLHLLGVAIVFDYEKDSKTGEKKLRDVFPARVPYRGFSEELNTIGYIQLTEYLERRSKETGVPFTPTMVFAMRNIDTLLAEAKE